MARLLIGSGAGSVSLDDTLRRLTNLSTHSYGFEGAATASGTVQDASGDTVLTTVTGTGLTYAANGVPYGGVYNSIIEARGDTLVVQLTGVALPVAAMIDTQTVNTGNGTTALRAAFKGFDLIQGNDGGNTLHGFAAGDVIMGGAGNDTLTAAAGGNILIPGLGQNTVNGGTGSDTVIIDAFRSQATLTNPVQSGFVSGPGFQDVLSSIESVRFTDGTTFYGTGTNGAEAYRLYQATLGRTPDVTGLGYWTNDLDRGVDIHIVAQGFVNSTEFKTTYGNLDNTGFVNTLYQNVLGRAGDASGIAYWTSNLSSGALSRSDVVVNFSESSENVAKTAPQVQQGVFGISPAATDVLRIYELLLGRAPDASGMKYWTEQHGGPTAANALATTGVNAPAVQSMDTIEREFMATGEYRAIYDALPNQDFVAKAYVESFGRPADAPGLSYWTTALNTGALSRQAVLHNFAESQEMTTKIGNLVQNGIKF